MAENRFQPVLKRTLNRRCDFFSEPDSATEFIHFITHQLFRTPMIRNINAKLENKIPDLDLNRTWLIESHIYATNVGAGIFVERDTYQFTFLENNTNIPFITSDQPVINLNTQDDKDIRLYYPLSPKQALIFSTGAPPQKICRTASALEVEQYNHQMFNRSSDQVYSNDRDYLSKVATLPTILN
jgi:Protein of unknown function (DUF4238)